MFGVMKIFITDISASTGRNYFIFDLLWHGDLYRVSPFQVYCTSTSCLPCDLEFFMFAVMKIFITDISASTGRNDFIFDIWLWHGDLYRVSLFQVYRTSISCLQSDLEFFIFAVIKTFVTDISASTGRNDFIPPLIERGLYCNHLVRPSIRSHFRYRFLSFYWKK